MKKLLILAPVFTTMLTGCQSFIESQNARFEAYEQPTFTNNFDKFDNKQVASWHKSYRENIYTQKRFIELSGNTVPLIFDVMVSASKELGGKKHEYNLILLSQVNRHHKYLRCHSAKWLADGKPVKTVQVFHDSKVESNGGVHVSETITSAFATSEFKKLASASHVEYKICNGETYFSLEELNGLKQVYNTIYGNN